MTNELKKMTEQPETNEIKSKKESAAAMVARALRSIDILLPIQIYFILMLLSGSSVRAHHQRFKWKICHQKLYSMIMLITVDGQWC